jgi:outer membrane lipoprotein SlyB
MTAARFLLREDMRHRRVTLEDDTLLGGLVGVLAGATFATALGATGGMLAFGATLGLLAGFIAGMLVWLETAELAEDPIPPVRPHAPRTRR